MFVCSECGHGSSTRLGKCPSCGAFGSFKKLQGVKSPIKKKGERLTTQTNQQYAFWNIENKELLRIFQSGIKQGANYLLAGEPGIGKSTLILQLIQQLLTNQTLTIGYASGEETSTQIQERTQRLFPQQTIAFDLFETSSCEDCVTTIQEGAYQVFIIDSIQTIRSSSSDSAPGSPSQVRICCDLINQAARTTGTTIIYIGHITKSGEIAGPKYLEHIVDVVCYLEGDRGGQYRFLRSKKNRFGTTDETGIFSMTSQGLTPVTDLRNSVLSSTVSQPGSVLSIGIDNGRPMLVAIEVLTTKPVGNYPQRNTIGIETNRLNLLLAVLEKHCGVKLARNDVYINIPGEVKYRDSGLDLGVAAALLSDSLNKTIGKETIFLGEISLSGKILPPSYLAKRQAEAKGFEIVDHTLCTHINQLPGFL